MRKCQRCPRQGLYGVRNDEKTDAWLLSSYAADGTTKTITTISSYENIAQDSSCIDQQNGIYYFMSQSITNGTTDFVGVDLATGKQTSYHVLPFAEGQFTGTGQMMASGLPNGDIIVGGQLNTTGPFLVGSLNPSTGKFSRVASLPAALAGDSPDVVPSAYSPKYNLFVGQFGSGGASPAWYYVDMGSGKSGSWPVCGEMETIDWDPSRDAFIGVGLTGDTNRTVVAMNATTGECTLLGQIDGYYILDGAEAALDASSGTLWTLLAPSHGANFYHLLGLDTTASPIKVVQDHALKQESPWQLEHYHGM